MITLSPYALIDLATVKDLVGVPAGITTFDTRLTMYINSATAIVEKYCDRIIAQRSGLTDIFDGRASNKLLLRQFPVVSVQSITFADDGNFTDPTNLIDPSAYGLEDDSVVFYTGQIVPSGYRNVQVSYTAGYSPIPDDLIQAAAWMVEWFYQFNANRDIGRSSKSKGDENSLVLQSMPEIVMDTVQYYKRCEFASSDSAIGNY